MHGSAPDFDLDFGDLSPSVAALPELVLEGYANETARAVAAPRRAVSEVVDLTAEFKTRTGDMSLRPIQSQMLAEFTAARGGLGFVGVGHGKTLPSFLIGTALGADLTIVLTLANTVAQTMREYARLKTHWHLPKNIKILGYNTLSRPENSAFLSQKADLHGSKMVVVADECHELSWKMPRSSRTRRVGDLIKGHPGIRFVGMSGSMTDRSIKDYAHLAEWALGEGSPVPRVSEQRFESHLDAWAQCVDAAGRPGSDHWNVTWPLLEAWGHPVECRVCSEADTGRWCPACGGTGDARSMIKGEERQAYAQRALRRRLSQCRGVVLSTESSLDRPLIIQLHEPAIPEPIQSLLDRVEYDSERPDGEILPDDLSKARVRSTLTMGYYQRWEWPDGKADEDWLMARRRWNALVRKELEVARDHYDSPFLVWGETARQVKALKESPDAKWAPIHAAWLNWEEQRQKEQPPSAAVWVHEFWLEHVQAKIASFTAPTIVWYQSKPVELALQLLGLATFGAGSRIPEDGAKTIAASILVHGTGRNLQAYRASLVLEPPASGKKLEQLLGRLHRAGQSAERVTFDVYGHGSFGDVLASARRNAKYIQESTGNVQKANLATWIEAPERASKKVSTEQ